MDEKVTLTDDEWRQRLTPEQYAVLRKASTERPFTGQYVHVDDKGVYTCAGCGAELFSSDTKFELRDRLAELLRSAECGRRRAAPGLEHGHPAHGDSLRQMRRPPRPCLP